MLRFPFSMTLDGNMQVTQYFPPDRKCSSRVIFSGTTNERTISHCPFPFPVNLGSSHVSLAVQYLVLHA
jgi:hypothetical protein